MANNSSKEENQEVSVDTVFRKDYFRMKDNKIIGDEYFSIDI